MVEQKIALPINQQRVAKTFSATYAVRVLSYDIIRAASGELLENFLQHGRRITIMLLAAVK